MDDCVVEGCGLQQQPFFDLSKKLQAEIVLVNGRLVGVDNSEIHGVSPEDAVRLELWNEYCAIGIGIVGWGHTIVVGVVIGVVVGIVVICVVVSIVSRWYTITAHHYLRSKAAQR